jgi:hypothetical protein
MVKIGVTIRKQVLRDSIAEAKKNGPAQTAADASVVI